MRHKHLVVLIMHTSEGELNLYIICHVRLWRSRPSTLTLYSFFVDAHMGPCIAVCNQLGLPTLIFTSVSRELEFVTMMCFLISR